ncbi:MAG: Thiol-disulfide oxidoreductase ResA [Stenotrophomonas maltophilia]|uniref:Thiol-disulfide oxidoreductase ResA n=1 Tax=Stenotrophomonas maltophilia TaxID=40324 RepID=A0A7V8FGC7_STEMA|nr:MAG: Thiol-disulfide oxidoreductase ResA [Stenotrophomonas maltophilia]
MGGAPVDAGACGAPVPAAAPRAAVPTLQVGDALPALVLPQLDGSALDLRRHATGRPLLVNVWASWCGPCIEEMPELARFAEAQGT